MAASKYHLMAIVPVVVLAQKRWRLAAGAMLGLAILLAISFAVAGWDWPRHYLAVIRDPALVPDMSHSPTLYALFQLLPYGNLLEAAAILVLRRFPASRYGNLTRRIAACSSSRRLFTPGTSLI